MKTIKQFTTAFAIAAICLNSCKKDETTPDDHDHVHTEKLSFHIHSVVGNQSADTASTYATVSGRKFTISDWRYYISNIVLIKSDNSEYPLTGKVLLVDMKKDDYELADVPTGSYKGVKFYIGLDSATNHKDPATYASGDPLAIQTPGIHWSWNSGYIFMKLEGLYDTTASANGNANTEYFFHCGTDNLKQQIDFSTHAFNVNEGQSAEIVLSLDMLDILNNVDLRAENATHTMDNMMLATKIITNAASAIEAE